MSELVCTPPKLTLQGTVGSLLAFYPESRTIPRVSCLLDHGGVKQGVGFRAQSPVLA